MPDVKVHFELAGAANADLVGSADLERAQTL